MTSASHTRSRWLIVHCLRCCWCWWWRREGQQVASQPINHLRLQLVRNPTPAGTCCCCWRQQSQRRPHARRCESISAAPAAAAAGPTCSSRRWRYQQMLTLRRQQMACLSVNHLRYCSGPTATAGLSAMLTRHLIEEIIWVWLCHRNFPMTPMTHFIVSRCCCCWCHESIICLCLSLTTVLHVQ